MLDNVQLMSIRHLCFTLSIRIASCLDTLLGTSFVLYFQLLNYLSARLRRLAVPLGCSVVYSPFPACSRVWQGLIISLIFPFLFPSLTTHNATSQWSAPL